MLANMLRQVFRGAAGNPADALVDAGNALAAAGDHAGALERYERAIALAPDLAVAHNNRALSLFALGRLREAWAEYEWRFQMQAGTRRFVAAPPLPRWDGSALSGDLLVLWEQGLGDIIQHLRFLPLAAERVHGVAFLCPGALVGLARHSFPRIDVIEARKGEAPQWARYAAQVPLLSLPHALGLDPDMLPAQAYLRAPGRVPAAAPADGFRVGIVWRTSGDEPHRDCPLGDMLALAQGGARLVSLQFRPNAGEAEQLARAGVEQRAGDFLATADEAMRVHAIVSVDTSMVHLAAALGRPTFALLNEPYFVRWTMHGETSPWYPSLRLLRKRATEPWPVLIARVAARLDAMTGGGR